ncbi:hypothetical protein Tco_0409780 [Tanacetum coccineum]
MRCPCESPLACRNEMGRGLAQRPVIVEVSHDLKGDSWGCVSRSLFWREDLDGDGERGFDCLTFALVSSKGHCEGCRASRGFEGKAFEPDRKVRHQAHRSNVMYTSMYVLLSNIIHKQDRRPCSKLHILNSETHLPQVMSAKDTIAVQHCGFSAKELNEFLSSYPIPSEYDVILPTSTQTIFDAPPGYVSLYTPSFSLANLRLPLTNFFCEDGYQYGNPPTAKALHLRGRASTKIELRLFKAWKLNNHSKNSSISSKPGRTHICTISGAIRGTATISPVQTSY